MHDRIRDKIALTNVVDFSTSKPHTIWVECPITVHTHTHTHTHHTHVHTYTHTYTHVYTHVYTHAHTCTHTHTHMHTRKMMWNNKEDTYLLPSMTTPPVVELMTQ